MYKQSPMELCSTKNMKQATAESFPFAKLRVQDDSVGGSI